MHIPYDATPKTIGVVDATLSVPSSTSVQEGSSVALVLTASTDDGGATSWDLHFGDGNSDPYISIPAPTPDNPNPSVEIDYTYSADEGESFNVTADVYDDYTPCGGQPDDTPYDATPQTIDITDAPITFNPSDPISMTEGDGTTTLTLGTISDPGTDPSPDPTYTGTIDWSNGATSDALFDGTTVYCACPFTDEGDFTGNVNVQDDGGQPASGTVAVHVADASIGVSVSGPSGAVEGQPLTNAVVGTVNDNNPNAPASDFSGTIDWGDGPNGPDGTSTSAASFQAVPGQRGVFNILGSHTYKEEGGFDMVITVNDKGGSSNGTGDSGYFNVADAAISLASSGPINASEGLSTGLVTVATLTDTNPNPPLSDFANNVTIQWGDGSSDAATLVYQNNGVFLVQGSHIYAEEGQFQTAVYATDAGGSSADPPAISFADVQDASISLTPVPVGVIEQTPVGTISVATLQDSNTSNTDTTDFNGTFTFGDQSQQTGNLQFISLGGGTFDVRIDPSSAQHVYNDEGTFTMVPTVDDIGGAPTATCNTPVAVAEGAMGVSLASPIIQGSTDGRTNLTALTLTTHNEPTAAWGLDLFESDTAQVVVWATPTPGPNDQPLLGMVNGSFVRSVAWLPNAPVPTTLYVGATHGSSQVGDVNFVLAEADASGPADAVVSPGYTAVRARITSVLDPNNDGLTDLTDQTRKLLVGQMVHDTVTLEAPSAWQADATYSWAQPSGTTLYSYDPTGYASVSVPLAGYNGPLGGGGVETGTYDKDIAFFWVTVPSTNPTTLQVSVDVEGQNLSPVSTFVDVEAPTATVGTLQTGTARVYWQDPNVYVNGNGDYWVEAGNGNPQGFVYPASVKMPSWVTKPGNWTFLQTLDLHESVTTPGGTQWPLGLAPTPIYVNGLTLLDTSFPAPTATIHDSSGTQVSSASLPADGTTYSFSDTPGDDLTASRNVYEPLYHRTSGTTIIEETRDDQFAAYMMFLPPGTASSWVPLKVVNWSWKMDVVQQPDTSWAWAANSGNPNPTANSAQDASAEPEWGLTFSSSQVVW